MNNFKNNKHNIRNLKSSYTKSLISFLLLPIAVTTTTADLKAQIYPLPAAVWSFSNIPVQNPLPAGPTFVSPTYTDPLLVSSTNGAVFNIGAGSSQISTFNSTIPPYSSTTNTANAYGWNYTSTALLGSFQITTPAAVNASEVTFFLDYLAPPSPNGPIQISSPFGSLTFFGTGFWTRIELNMTALGYVGMNTNYQVSITGVGNSGGQLDYTGFLIPEPTYVSIISLLFVVTLCFIKRFRNVKQALHSTL